MATFVYSKRRSAEDSGVEMIRAVAGDFEATEPRVREKAWAINASRVALVPVSVPLTPS